MVDVRSTDHLREDIGSLRVQFVDLTDIIGFDGSASTTVSFCLATMEG
jgi:hypothetical protein